jgi:hypothetical protein
LSWLWYERFKSPKFRFESKNQNSCGENVLAGSVPNNPAATVGLRVSSETVHYQESALENAGWKGLLFQDSNLEN